MNINRVILFASIGFCATGLSCAQSAYNPGDPASRDFLLLAIIQWLLRPPPAECTPALMGGVLQGCPLNLSGVVSTPFGPAQGSTTSGDTDGTGNSARFNQQYNVTTPDGKIIFVADAANNKIRKIVLETGAVTTFAGPAQGTTTSGDTDATGNAARFFNPTAITTDGTNLYVGDASNNKIRRIVISSRSQGPRRELQHQGTPMLQATLRASADRTA